MQNTHSLAHILVVDDEQTNLDLIRMILRLAGYGNIVTTTQSCEVPALCAQQVPDLIILDLMMPGLDGYGVIAQLSPLLESEHYLPILIVTADIMPETKRTALAAGAKDFITKPFDRTELLLRVHNLLETRSLYEQLQNQNRVLEERVAHRTHDLTRTNKALRILNAQLEESQLEVLTRLAQAAELRDDDTGQHTQRVATLTACLAQQIGLSEEHVETLRRAAPLHDVGKIGISDTLLLKPRKLTPKEFEIVKTHTTIGGALLADGHSPMVKMAHTIALTHHEHWNGGGYPYGISKNEIPLEGRILSVVDVYDALTHVRPYKNAWSVEEAREEIKRGSGTQFDPEIVRAFLGMQLELQLN